MKNLIMSGMCIWLLTGCSTLLRGAPERPFDVSHDLKLTAFAFDEATFATYRAETDQTVKRQLRDDIINAQIHAYDLKFGQFEEGLFSYGIGTGIGTDWLSIGISGLTSVYGGKGTKEVLGALNAGLTGAKGSIDKRLFLEKTTPAIAAEMVSQRTAVMVDIRTGLSNDVSQYNLYQALADVERYRRAGTLSGGLNGIVKSAGDETVENEERISDIISGNYQKDEAGDFLRSFWKPDGQTVDTTNEGVLKGWMAQNNLQTGPGSITMFLRDSQYADLRIMAADELK